MRWNIFAGAIGALALLFVAAGCANLNKVGATIGEHKTATTLVAGAVGAYIGKESGDGHASNIATGALVGGAAGYGAAVAADQLTTSAEEEAEQLKAARRKAEDCLEASRSVYDRVREQSPDPDSNDTVHRANRESEIAYKMCRDGLLVPNERRVSRTQSRR